MTVGDENLLKIVRGLISTSPEAREESSETVCDWIHSFDCREARMVAALLSSVVMLETVSGCRESELNALSELTATGFIEANDLAPLQRLQRNTLQGSELEHFDYLSGEYFQRARGAGSAGA
ncbi:hypothetical protein ABZ208_04875 [Streptomyces sp. NPDC006208]|uniref:hypothetical protein n=1 Tax=Streptomyces sp. NPDC006208 TaxID=3156734 RepID=UPI0033AE2165